MVFIFDTTHIFHSPPKSINRHSSNSKGDPEFFEQLQKQYVVRVQHFFPAAFIPIQDFRELSSLGDTLVHVLPAIVYFDILRMD